MKGVPIIGVIPGSLADKAGLRKGDSLLSVNGQEIDNIGDFLDARRTAMGVLNIRILRNGQISEVEFCLNLGERPPLAPHDILAMAAQLPHALAEKPPMIH